MKKLTCLLFFLSTMTVVNQQYASWAAQSNNLAAVVEKALPAVVFVAHECDYFEAAFGANPTFPYWLFRPVYNYLWPPVHSIGSGYIISPDGYIVTNVHVVDGATTLLVITKNPDYRICKARLIGTDPRTDVALLKIINDNQIEFPYLTFANSDKVKVGETAIALGNPLGLESTVTVGVVSAKDRNFPDFPDPIQGYIQTDAAINGGNSCGPLINKMGEVIGMNTWILDHYRGFEGLGFAVSSNIIQCIVAQLKETGKVEQGSLGVIVDNEQETAFDVYYFDNEEGASIDEVIDGSPADEAGLLPGDIILAIDGNSVISAKSLRNQIWMRSPNTTVELTVDRDGEILQITVVLGNEYSISGKNRYHVQSYVQLAI